MRWALMHEMLTGKKMFDADGSFAVMRATWKPSAAPSACNPRFPRPSIVVARAVKGSGGVSGR
jgi:hypothetical protein